MIFVGGVGDCSHYGHVPPPFKAEESLSAFTSMPMLTETKDGPLLHPESQTLVHCI